MICDLYRDVLAFKYDRQQSVKNVIKGSLLAQLLSTEKQFFLKKVIYEIYLNLYIFGRFFVWLIT